MPSPESHHRASRSFLCFQCVYEIYQFSQHVMFGWSETDDRAIQRGRASVVARVSVRVGPLASALRRRRTRRPPYGSAAVRAVHLPPSQPPTKMIETITATSMIPSSTVYSMSAAPSSSRRSPRTSSKAFCMNRSLKTVSSCSDISDRDLHSSDLEAHPVDCTLELRRVVDPD